MGAGAWERRAAAEAAARNREREESLRAERARRQNALQLEKDTVTRARLREQAEARVAEARRRREAEVAAEDAAAQARLRAQYGEQSLFPESGSAGFRPVPTAEEQAAARVRVREFALGPERDSIIPFVNKAPFPERFIRNWFSPEEELRTAAERAGEGRLGAAAGWTGLAILGALPPVRGARSVAVAGRVGETTADAARAAENLRAATIARATPEQISSVTSVGPLPNRAKEAVTQQSRTLDSLRETQLSTMHRLTPDDLEELRRASPAVRQMSPDNIWVIHETSFPPSRSGSDIVLRPTADYVSETGRHSVHFSLNHSAAGHEFRQGAGLRYVVAARLSDVLEANPGSLDNLYSVDTFFTPRPGEGLRIPNATVLEDAQSVSTQQAIRNLIEESGGVAIAGGPRYSPITGVDVRIRQLAEELRVPSMTHDGHPLFRFESNFLNGFGNADPNFYLPLMSNNARLRVSGENVWTHPSMDSLRRSRFVDPDV